MTSRSRPRVAARRVLLRSLQVLAALASPGLLEPRAAIALMAGLPPDHPQRRQLANDLDSPWSGVGAVLVDDAVYSGVLIDARHVLTAAHVVAGHATARIRFRINAGSASGIIAAAATVIHPGYRGFPATAGPGAESPVPAYDVAIIRLARPAPATVATYAPWFGSVRPGTVLTLIGYGMSGHGHEGPSVPAQADVRRIGQNVLDRFAMLPDAPTTPGIFLYDFDPPPVGPRRSEAGTAGRDASGRNRLGGPSLGNDVETMVAPGDSGAPAFIVRGQYRALIGLLTFAATAAPGAAGTPAVNSDAKPGAGLSRFGGIGGGILLGPLRDWIEQVQRAP